MDIGAQVWSFKALLEFSLEFDVLYLSLRCQHWFLFETVAV